MIWTALVVTGRIEFDSLNVQEYAVVAQYEVEVAPILRADLALPASTPILFVEPAQQALPDSEAITKRVSRIKSWELKPVETPPPSYKPFIERLFGPLMSAE